MIKNIFFDFDGVILDSVNVKTLAFMKLYEPYGEKVVEKVKDHHLKNGGVSRYKKIKTYHNYFLGRDISENEIEKIAKNFAKIVFDQVLEAPYVPGVLDFIKNGHNKFRFSIISGTPTNELEKIVLNLGIDQYFQEIYASPKSKITWVNEIIKNACLKKEETLFIGDAQTDFFAASSTGVHFLLRETQDCAKYFLDYHGPRVCDFYDLEKVVKEHF